MKRNINFHYKRFLEGSPVEPVLLREVEIEPNVKLECVSKFNNLGDTLGAGGGVEEVARVRCAWANRYYVSLD